MTYFLEKIARSLHAEFGNSLNSHCLVFPNRRAGLYFLKYLAASIEKPVWSPAVFTVNELFRSSSSLQIAGNEILLFELYKVYRKLTKTPDSFDDFYFWGDMLLNDFDDIDKYLVNASLLFSNVQDIKNIDHQFGGLTPSQIEIIRRFWVNFNPLIPTKEKAGFITIWSVLNDLYNGFRSSLYEKNLAYEGMIFRELAESKSNDHFPATPIDMVHFIGFNALNECEKTIMLRLKKAGKARFYWDYDNSFINEGKWNSAGLFLRENLKIFGNDMPADWSFDTMLSVGTPAVQRRVIDTSSDVAQVKLISRLIEDIPGLTPENAHHTAVVLADENLLMPVLTSLPENAGDINITMGHPLKQTLVYTLLKHLMELQRNARETAGGTITFDYRSVISILKNSLMSGLMSEADNKIIKDITDTNLVRVPSSRFTGSEYLPGVFKRPSTPLLLSAYFKDLLSLIASDHEQSANASAKDKVKRNIRNEFIYRVVLSINRLESIVNSPDVSFTTETYMKILDRMLRIQSVPFSGEPLSGIQIMGILETRALDFKNLIILSVNEGVLPAVSSGSSFIPFNLREAFGLPSVNHQESVYAYHFYRLLQRAENVTFTFNSNSEGLQSGEMSRFLIQMKYEPLLQPDFQNLSFEIKTQGSVGSTIERNEEHSLRLNSRFLDSSKNTVLSPSAINTWLNCRMKFYYRYVNQLKEPERVSADIDPAMLGNILHDTMKSLYNNYENQVVSGEIFGSLIGNKPMLSRVVNDIIKSKFKNEEDGQAGGNELIVRDVLMAYVSRILSTDRSIAPLTIIKLEQLYDFRLSVSSNGSDIQVATGGKIDRIDAVNGVTRIVDYKTGTVADVLNSITDLFADDRKKDPDGWLQTLLYCEAYLVNVPGTVLCPSVYKIKKLTGGTLSDKLRVKTGSKTEVIIDDYSLVRGEFIDGLKGIISKIFSNNEPFSMTADTRGKCSYCPYSALCLR
jgi:hypothetical protein